MQQHRYWRILCAINNANYNSFQAAEIQFRAVAGGPALTGTVASTTPNAGDTTAAQAIDGNPNTCLITSPSTAFPHFFSIDLGAGNDSPVWEIAIMPRVGQPAYAPRDFLVQWSDDGSTWTTATTVNYVETAQYTASAFTTWAVDSSDSPVGPDIAVSLPLVNPSADFGNTTGWVNISGAGPNIGTNPGSGGGPDATTHSGLNSFIASANGGSAVWGQTVDIPSSEWDNIDAGMYWANAMCWLKTWSGDEDYGRLNVSCLDASGNSLAIGYGQYFSGNNTMFWKKVGANVAAPAGTRKLLIWTEAYRTNGTELSVYYDDFELNLIYPPDMSPAIPHRHWKMVIDANNGDNTYTTINQVEWLDASGTPATGGYFDVNAYINNSSYPVVSMASGTDSVNCAITTRGHSWVSYDLGGGQSFAATSLRVRHRHDGYNTQAIKDFRALWSDDGINFYDVAKWERATSWGNNESRTFVFAADRYRIRYYQLSGAASPMTTGTYFKGLQLRATVGGDDLTVPCEAASGLGGYAFGDPGNYGASVVFDNLANDNYVGNGSADRFIEWQFPTTTEIAEIALTARQTVGSQAPNILQVERSPDGFTYTQIAYIQSGTFTNGQTKSFAIADWRDHMMVSKVGTYVLEGPTYDSINATKLGTYVVEGMKSNVVFSSRLGSYVIEGPGGISFTKMGAYIVEGPPAPGTFGPFVDAGGHRYWRIFIRRSNSNDQWPVGVTDMELRRSDGRNIVGFGGTPIASVDVSTQPNWKAISAFDGLTTTMWQPDKNSQTVSPWGHGQWLGYDFGDGWTPRIDEIVIMPNKDSVSRTPAFFEVQYSDDGSNWATDWIVCYRGAFTLNTPLSFTRPVFDDPRKGRYWALHALSLQNNTTYQNLGGTEFQMMNEEDGTNLALNKTGFRSSAAGSENVQNLFDGNTANNNYFSTTTPNIVGSDYVGCDFGPSTSIEVRQFVWRSRNDNSTLYQQSPVAGQMLRSNDGTNFVPMWQFSNLSYSGPGVSVTVNTPLPVATLVRGRRRNPNIVVF